MEIESLVSSHTLVSFLHHCSNDIVLILRVSLFPAWNIMGHKQIKNLAEKAPTNMDELADCDIPENVRKSYGERILKNINVYIETNKLQKYVEGRPKKKPKSGSVQVTRAPEVVSVLEGSRDEFQDDGIDFSAIPLPNCQADVKADKPISKLKSSKSSSYFK